MFKNLSIKGNVVFGIAAMYFLLPLFLIVVVGEN